LLGVGRIYSGILGPLAFLTVVARGFIHGASATSTLYWAWLALIAFAAAGYVAGAIAGRVVEDSVKATLAAELAANEERTKGLAQPESSQATPT